MPQCIHPAIENLRHEIGSSAKKCAVVVAFGRRVSSGTENRAVEQVGCDSLDPQVRAVGP